VQGVQPKYIGSIKKKNTEQNQEQGKRAEKSCLTVIINMMVNYINNNNFCGFWIMTQLTSQT
jgi:hypothetical protein